MFSESGLVQEVLALVIAAIALVYVVAKLTGWRPFSRRKPKQDVPVTLGGRLARGLKTARRTAQKTAGDPGPPH